MEEMMINEVAEEAVEAVAANGNGTKAVLKVLGGLGIAGLVIGGGIWGFKALKKKKAEKTVEEELDDFDDDFI